MYVKYGAYRHRLAGVGFTIAKQTIRNERNVRYGILETWTLGGELLERTGSVAALTKAIEDLEAAYAVENQDLVLYTSTMAATAHSLRVEDCLTGVRVTAPPSYPVATGPDYANKRTFTITLEGIRRVPETANALQAWSESLSFQGNGGPDEGYLEPVDGTPVRQRFKAATLYRAKQTGSAIGLLGYPTPSDPLWPGFLQNAEQAVSYSSPKYDGTRFTNYQVTWDYAFVSSSPLRGLPNAN